MARGNTADGDWRWDGYSCRVGNHASPELAWRLTLDSPMSVTFELLGAEPNEVSHDGFVLFGDEGGDCVERGFNGAEVEGWPSRTHTLVADGTGPERAGEFRARVICKAT